MAIELAFTKAGEVLAAPEHLRLFKPRQKFAGIFDGFARISRNRARSHDVAGSLKRKVENWRKIYIETKSAAASADDLAVFAKCLRMRSCEYLGRGRCGTERNAKAIDGATLEVDACKKRSLHAPLTLAQQTPSLFWSSDVARKKNHSRGLHTPEQGSESRLDLHTIEANDEQLPRVVPQTFLRAPLGLNFLL